MNEVGSHIKHERINQGYSQNALAKRAGIAQATLSAIEAATKSPSVETVILLAKALDVSVSQLITGKKIDQGTQEDPLIDQIIKNARKLTPERRQQLEDYARFLADQK